MTPSPHNVSLSPAPTLHQIGQLFQAVGLTDLFDIAPTEDLRTNPQGKTALLIGFLKAAVEGHLHDPQHLDQWQEAGQQALQTHQISLTD